MLLDLEPPLNMYTCNVAEDNVICFKELKGIKQGTMTKVYMDEFNFHLEFCTAWRNLYHTFLEFGAKDTLTAQLENTIQNLHYCELHWGFTFATYV